MQHLESIAECRDWCRDQPAASLGFVPTMGALHDGHLSLVQQSLATCERTLVSIFVNPAQFDDPNDLEKYPQTLASDLATLREAGADAVFLPSAGQLYPDGYRVRVSETDISNLLCGAHRPGHFDGVLTVVLKLFNIVTPGKAFFGEKDYQQLQLIRELVRAMLLPIAIVAVPTVREADGLAMSSRNTRLSASARAKAPRLHELLASDHDCATVRRELEKVGFSVDYVEEHWGRRLAAVRLEGVRLIDNVER